MASAPHCSVTCRCPSGPYRSNPNRSLNVVNPPEFPNPARSLTCTTPSARSMWDGYDAGSHESLARFINTIRYWMSITVLVARTVLRANW